jgi:hypothetical protein
MRIPIRDAKIIADANGCTQVIIAAWDGKNTHIVTYGKTVEDCAQAAAGGNLIKKTLGWPKDLNAEPKRVQKLLDRIAELEAKITDIGTTKPRIPPRPAVLVVSITEYERGWGSKNDGYLLFVDEAEAQAFIAEKYALREDGPAPEYYVNYDNTGWWPASETIVLKVLASPRKYISIDSMKELES